MGDNYEDVIKENVQPLKNGRDDLRSLDPSTTEDESKPHLHEQRRSLAQMIMGYSGTDPLERWLRYIQWVEENYPKGSKEGDLLKVLEDCLEAMKGSKYKSDGRLLGVHLQYLDLSGRDGVEYFNRLFMAGYFQNLAMFYISWADAVNDFNEGNRIYQLGMLNKAEPAIKLEKGYKHFQARVECAAVFKSIPEKSKEEHNALVELEYKTLLPSGVPNSTPITPSTDIPCDPADLMVEVEDVEAETEADLFQHRQTAGEEEDQTRPCGVPVLPDDMPIQSTSLQAGNEPSIPVCEDATLRLPREEIQPAVPEETEPLPASASVATSRLGLSAFEEMLPEYASSSGSSAGPTGLASQLSVGSSLPSVRRRTPAFFTPTLFVPFESVHLQHRETNKEQKETGMEVALYWACMLGDLDTVKNCVEIGGADPNARVDRCGFSYMIKNAEMQEMQKMQRNAEKMQVSEPGFFGFLSLNRWR